jgi:hypothetical protein
MMTVMIDMLVCAVAVSSEGDLVDAHTTGTKEHNEKSKADHVVPFVNLRDLCVRSPWRRCRETATERRRYSVRS